MLNASPMRNSWTLLQAYRYRSRISTAPSFPLQHNEQ